MKKILFIDKNPYGNLVDTYKYCLYLQDKYEITYVCIDYGYTKINPGRVHVVYVPNVNCKLFRGLTFSILALYYALINNGFIFVSYYQGCDFLKRILFWKRMHVDIRTLSVASDANVREEWNNTLNRAILRFDSISFITEGVRNQLNIPEGKETYIIPLGADAISVSDKNFSYLNLLYVGTLNNRRIIDTLVGFHRFLLKHPNKGAHYIIIGDGEELQEIKKYVSENNLSNQVDIKGKIPYTELKPYFDKCNIGVSYIPITDYYQHQPPTKTYEYIMSGLYCLATRTIENQRIVDESNGCLHEDNAESFSEALEKTMSLLSTLNSDVIKDTLKGHTWGGIVENCLIPLLG